MANLGESVFVYEICEGFRKGSELLYIPETKQLYKIKSKSRLCKRYTCYKSECNASAVVEFNNENLVRVPKVSAPHNHSTQEDLRGKLKLLSEIKNECANVSLKRSGIREVFDEVCGRGETSASVQFGKVRRQLINIRNSSFPKAPTSASEICAIFKNRSVIHDFGMSRYKRSEPFYRSTVIEPGFSYSIFMSPTISEEIRKLPDGSQKNYLLDGTFSVVPSCGYKQLCLIHFAHDDHVYPFIYILMSNKSEKMYLHAFQYIEANLFKFCPSSFVTDFEKGLRNALQKIFPSAKYTTCWFHFCQAIRKKSSKLPGFFANINKKKEAKRLYRKFLVLPLLKPMDMESAFELLNNEAKGVQFKVKGECIFKHFLIYFRKQWIERETPSAVSVFRSHMRTTSAVEGYNSRLSRKLAKFGNFFKFVDCLLDEDVIKSKEFIMSTDGTFQIFEPPKKKFKDRGQQIEAALIKLEKKRISIQDFLNQMTNESNNLLSEDSLIESVSSEDEDDLKPDDVEPDYFNVDDVSLLCIICCKNARTILLQPCNHFKLCLNCYTGLSDKYLKLNNPILCPICRQIVQSTTKIYC